MHWWLCIVVGAVFISLASILYVNRDNPNVYFKGGSPRFVTTIIIIYGVAIITVGIFGYFFPRGTQAFLETAEKIHKLHKDPFHNLSIFSSIEHKPEFADAYYDRGHAKQAKGDLDGAIAYYSKAIEFKPDYPEAYHDRGHAKQAKGDLDGAIADFTKAIEFKPEFADAYYDRGHAKQAKGDLGGAIADFTKAIEFKPGAFQ
jgi:tetratricopeptide (TPR) repeat protein